MSRVVTPKKGSAILIYNLEEPLHMDGVVNRKSMHAECDTEVGILFV